MFTRVSAVETVVNLMAMYLHFGPQVEFVSGVMAKNIERLETSAVSLRSEPARCPGVLLTRDRPGDG